MGKDYKEKYKIVDSRQVIVTDIQGYMIPGSPIYTNYGVMFRSLEDDGSFYFITVDREIGKDIAKGDTLWLGFTKARGMRLVPEEIRERN